MMIMMKKKEEEEKEKEEERGGGGGERREGGGEEGGGEGGGGGGGGGGGEEGGEEEEEGGGGEGVLSYMCKLLLFCSLLFYLATPVHKFHFRFVTNRTPNKRQTVKSDGCSDRDFCCFTGPKSLSARLVKRSGTPNICQGQSTSPESSMILHRLSSAHSKDTNSTYQLEYA
jgi:hypothetical protein